MTRSTLISIIRNLDTSYAISSTRFTLLRRIIFIIFFRTNITTIRCKRVFIIRRVTFFTRHWFSVFTKCASGITLCTDTSKSIFVIVIFTISFTYCAIQIISTDTAGTSVSICGTGFTEISFIITFLAFKNIWCWGCFNRYVTRGTCFNTSIC